MARPRKTSDPAETPPQNHVRSRLLVGLEWVWFFVLLIPYILHAFYRRLVPPKYKSLNGKVVLVTGAARGLGKELALRFARLGCKVACVDIKQDMVLDTAAEIVRDGERAKAYFTNVAKLEDIRELRAAVTKDLGPVDILVNNASILYGQRLEDTPDDHIRTIVDVNFLGYVWMLREFLEPMRERNGGHIVTISSMSAHSALPGATIYGACKWAVTGFVESVRLELLEGGCNDIHFTTVFPTYMDNMKMIIHPRKRNGCLRMEAVAAKIVIAVRTNTVSISIPETSFYRCMLSKVLPATITDWFHKIDTREIISHIRPLQDNGVNWSELNIKDISK